MKATQIKKELRSKAHPQRAEIARSFFKTGIGQYGYGDKFIGVTVPEIRNIARRFKQTPFSELKNLLISQVHEERLCALVILTFQFQKGSSKEKHAIYNFYMKYRRYINNWDLVDVSAPHIIGGWLYGKNTKVLFKLARSRSIWDRRIAILSTFSFIRKGRYNLTLQIAKLLLKDHEDLIHKAVGWMLREIGKKETFALEMFLGKHCRTMPRTMLRYSIERLPITKRKKYLQAYKLLS